MKLKIMGAKRHIAKFQIHPLLRAKKELKDLGYELVDNDPDFTIVQITLLSSKSDMTVERLLNEVKTPIILLDDAASTGTHKFRLMHQYPDRFVGYIKKQLLRDRELYKTKYPRNRYHYWMLSSLGEAMDKEVKPDPEITDTVLSKVVLGWSLALMERHGVQVKEVPIYKKNIDIHFSIKTKHKSKTEHDNLNSIDNHYAFHRVGATREIERIAAKHGFSLSGKCKSSEYLKRMRASKLCLSPLGLGESCFRDMESQTQGAILVKPDMSHLETWPDIYEPNHTYFPVKWDWTDLEETVVKILDNYKDHRDMVVYSYNVIKRVWDNEVFALKFDSIIKSLNLK
jgi:hypothetical protein